LSLFVVGENYNVFVFVSIIVKVYIRYATTNSFFMTATATSSIATILYIDDDNDDCLILRSSLEDAGNASKLICANDGEEAVKYLNSVSPATM